VANAPLYTRGWVFQERLLAPRVLNFTRNQLFWECNDLHASKSWPAGLPPGTVAVFKKDVLRETAQKRDLDISLWAWNSVVRNYSAGGLLPGMNNRASLKHASPCPNPVYVTNSNFPLAQPFLLPNSRLGGMKQSHLVGLAIFSNRSHGRGIRSSTCHPL
jgi:hypothetical protein